jgi:hypothetical protein
MRQGPTARTARVRHFRLLFLHRESAAPLVSPSPEWHRVLVQSPLTCAGLSAGRAGGFAGLLPVEPAGRVQYCPCCMRSGKSSVIEPKRLSRGIINQQREIYIKFMSQSAREVEAVEKLPSTKDMYNSAGWPHSTANGGARLYRAMTLSSRTRAVLGALASRPPSGYASGVMMRLVKSPPEFQLQQRDKCHRSSFPPKTQPTCIHEFGH